MTWDYIKNVGIPEQYHQLSYYLARVEMLAVRA